MIQPPRPNRRAAMRGLTLALAAAASGLAFMGERAAHAAPAAPAAATSVQRPAGRRPH